MPKSTGHNLANSVPVAPGVSDWQRQQGLGVAPHGNHNSDLSGTLGLGRCRIQRGTNSLTLCRWHLAFRIDSANTASAGRRMAVSIQTSPWDTWTTLARRPLIGVLHSTHEHAAVLLGLPTLKPGLGQAAPTNACSNTPTNTPTITLMTSLYGAICEHSGSKCLSDCWFAKRDL